MKLKPSHYFSELNVKVTKCLGCCYGHDMHLHWEPERSDK